MKPALEQIKKTIFAARLPASVEAKMQLIIAERLTSAGIGHLRELILPGFGRIDFVADTVEGCVGIECKTQSTAMATARQLHRYGQSGRFDILILITARPMQLPISHIQYGQKKIPVQQWQIPAL